MVTDIKDDNIAKIKDLTSQWISQNIKAEHDVNEIECRPASENVRGTWRLRIKKKHVDVVYKISDYTDVLVSEAQMICWWTEEKTLWFFFDQNINIVLVVLG